MSGGWDFVLTEPIALFIIGMVDLVLIVSGIYIGAPEWMLCVLALIIEPIQWRLAMIANGRA